MGIDWGTDTPISVFDPLYNVPVDVRSYGDFSLQVENGQKLMERLVGQTQSFSHQEIQQYFTNLMATQVRSIISSTMLERRLSPIGIDAHLVEMSAAAMQKVAPIFAPYGLTIAHFTIAAITTPELDQIKSAALHLQKHRMETDVAAEDTLKAGRATAEVNRVLGFSAKEQAVADIGRTLAGNRGPAAAPANGGLSSTAGAADIARALLNPYPGAGAENDAPTADRKNGDPFEERVRKLKFIFDNGMISQERYQEKIDEIMREI